MTRLRVLIGMLLALGLAGIGSAHPTYAATTIQDCPATQSALSYDISQAGDGGTVQFNCVGPRTISFDTAGGGTGNPITLTQSVTLDGSSSQPVTFDGNSTTQLFVISSGDLTLNSVTLSGGYVDPAGPSDGGGAIENTGSGAVTIIDSTLAGNSSTTYGGAYLSLKGTLSITNSTVTSNSANVWGGAIVSGGTTTITHSSLTGNSANGGTSVISPVGGAVVNGGTLTITNSTLSGNSVSGWQSSQVGPIGGAAIYNSGTLTIAGSTFSSNSVAIGFGGAILNGGYKAGTLSITGSTFSDNSATSGGAIYNNPGTITVVDSTFSGNSASVGGGPGFGGGAIDVYSGSVNISSSTLTGNTAPAGGAIENFETSVLTITNSTLSGNSATVEGGAVENSFGAVSITDSTLTGNSATNAGGAIVNGDATMSIGGSIVAESSSGGNCLNAYSTVTDKGHNLTDSNGNCGLNNGSTDLTNTDPKLDPNGLQDNGGPTKTVALQPNSPAIDANSCSFQDSSGTVITSDQRGSARPDNGESSCDIGAYEFQDATTTTTVTSSSNPSVYGQTVTFTATVTASSGTATGTVEFKDGGTDIGGCGSVGLSSGATATCQTSTLSVGPHSITASYAPSSGSGFLASSGTLSGGQTVNKASTTTTVASSANPSMVGQQVTFTATVAVNSPGAGVPTGSVAFYDGNTLLGTRSLNGASPDVATFGTSSLGAGNHAITAVYSGDGNFLGSTSSALAQLTGYGVKLLYKAPASANSGSSIPIKIELVNYLGQNLSSSSLAVQALCVVPAGKTDCTAAPAGFTYSNQYFTYMASLAPGGGYQFNVKTTGLATGTTYQLLFRAAGEANSMYHADANATFTLTK